MKSSYKFRCRPEVNCVFVKHFGDITLDILMDRFSVIKRHSLYSPPVNFYIEFFDCQTKLSENDMREIARYIKSRKQHLKTYKNVILTNSPLGFGLLRMLQSLTEAGNVTTEILISREKSGRDDLRRQALESLNIPIDFDICFS